MSGRRRKALVKAFTQTFGRPPNRTRWEPDGFYPSEIRRLKKWDLGGIQLFYDDHLRRELTRRQQGSPA